MSSYRGSQGALALGGAIVGSPLVQGAEAQGQTTAIFDGGSFNGVIRPGDTFTVAGDGQTYTIVTGGVVGSSTPNELEVTFSPGVVPGGGWGDNAVVSFTSNSMAQIRSWDLDIERAVLDTTALGDTAESKDLDLPMWSGRATAQLDYGDADHATVIDQAIAGTDATALALTLVVASGKQFWGDVLTSRMSITGQNGAIYEVSFDFAGTGAVAANWN